MEANIIKSVDSIGEITRQEVDLAIATAKRYPRDIAKARSEVLEYATQSKEVAQACFYALPRGGKTIEGPSVRLAEIIMNAWGNLKTGARIIGNDGRMITAQAVCHDMERNVFHSGEISRRITNKQGQTFTEDMQIVTGNAAAKIALRNAIFVVVPAALTVDLQVQIKQFALGTDAKEEKVFNERKKKIIKSFLDLDERATEELVLKLVKAKTVKELNLDKAFTLLGVLNAINEGTTTIGQVLGLETITDSQKASEDFDQDQAPGSVDKQTGEIKFEKDKK